MTIAFGCVFALLGFFILVWNERQRSVASIASDWPVVMGQILESRVQYARPKMDEQDVLVFQYEYSVEGVSHMSRSIDLFEIEKRITVEEMEQIVRTYPLAAKVNVYYDVNDPSKSVIEPKNRIAYGRNRNLGVLLASVGVLVLGVATLTK
jgi:hypothetical protein